MHKFRFFGHKILRYHVTMLGFFQRIPMAVLGGVLFILGYFFYRIFGAHKLWVRMIKGWLKFFFFLNGIRLSPVELAYKRMADEVVLVNYFGMWDALLLWAYLPYKKLVILPAAFLQGKWVKKAAYLLGLYPAETHFDIHNYQKKNFILEPYAEAGFLLVEPIRVAAQAYQSIPYTLMIALKKGKNIRFLQLKGSEKCVFASFFKPIKIQLKEHALIPAHHRIEWVVVQYKAALKSALEYEKTRRYNPFSKKPNQ